MQISAAYAELLAAITAIEFKYNVRPSKISVSPAFATRLGDSPEGFGPFLVATVPGQTEDFVLAYED